MTRPQMPFDKRIVELPGIILTLFSSLVKSQAETLIQNPAINAKKVQNTET